MINKMRNWTVAVLFLFLLPLASAQITPNIWKKFIGEPVPAGTPDLIDFSYAGYKNGEEEIPQDFPYTVYDVTSYGATPDDGQSDTGAIRKAIDAANSSGGSVILFFPPGQYDVLLDDDPKEQFVIRTHRIIIRGSGSQGTGGGGTTIKVHNTLENPYDLTLFTTRGVNIRDTGFPVATRVNGSFPSGTNYFDVKDTTDLRNRKFIEIRADNLLGEDFDRLSSRPLSAIPATYRRIHEGIDIKELHEIDRIDGNRVYLKAPLITHLKSGMIVFWRDLLVGIGFEDLHIDGGFNETYEHLVQFGHGGIFLDQTAHSWIRRCRFSNVIDSFRLHLSYSSSALSNIVDGRFGHNLGGISFSTYCFIAFLEDYSDRGMSHGPAVSHYSAGSVVWFVGGPSTKGPDTHASQSRHTLFDNCYTLTHQTSGGVEGALPHHLDGYTRWNNNIADNSNLALWPSSGYGFSVTQGNLIGYRTLGGAIPRNAYIEGLGTRVFPDSLYEAQLARRLGTLPDWIDVSKNMHSEFVDRFLIDSPPTDTTETPSVDPNSGGPKIVGPWLWVLVPDEHFDGTTDLLAKVSGSVTEKQIATDGVLVGDKVGDYEWTSLRISATGGNNINDMTRYPGWSGENRVIYGFIALNSPTEQNTKMFVGSDDSVRSWLNGKLVHDNIKKRSASDYKESFPVTLRQGRNTLLVAVDNYTGAWSGFFGFRADTEYTSLPFAGIGYSLPNVEIFAGDRFTLEIYAEDATDLVEWQFDIAFNPLLLEAIEVRKGYFLEAESGETLFEHGTIDNKSGKIIGLSEAELNGNTVGGTGMLLSVTFAAKAGGNTQLTLNNFQFSNGTGQAISAGPLHVTLGLKGMLIWDVNADGLVDIFDIVFVAQSFGQPTSANSGADINGDGTIDISDLVFVAQHLGESTASAAPLTIALGEVEGLNPEMIQAWIKQAQAENDGSLAFRQGIENLQRLLTLLLPKKTVLLPNYPNPFNPETWIPYQLSKPAKVTLAIYSINGTLVRTLALGKLPAGIYQSRSRAAYWNGKNDVGESVASGIYFYKLTAGEFESTRKMLIQK